MFVYDFFVVLIVIYIIIGVLGLIGFWVLVFVKKGGDWYRYWGCIFFVLMLIMGMVVMMMVILILIVFMLIYLYLVEYLDFFNFVFVCGIFGWMMFYFGLLIVNLIWYGWVCVVNKWE